MDTKEDKEQHLKEHDEHKKDHEKDKRHGHIEIHNELIRTSVSTYIYNSNSSSWNIVLNNFANAVEKLLYDISKMISQYASIIANVGLTNFIISNLNRITAIRNLLSSLL